MALAEKYLQYFWLAFVCSACLKRLSEVCLLVVLLLYKSRSNAPKGEAVTAAASAHFQCHHKVPKKLHNGLV